MPTPEPELERTAAGNWVDKATGEVLFPKGVGAVDFARVAGERLRDARAQVKAWEQQVAVWSAWLTRQLEPGDAFDHDGSHFAIRQNEITDWDADAWVDWLCQRFDLQERIPESPLLLAYLSAVDGWSSQRLFDVLALMRADKDADPVLENPPAITKDEEAIARTLDKGRRKTGRYARPFVAIQTLRERL